MSSEGSATGSRVTLHVVASLDGFIARKDNSISWLDGNGSVYQAGVSISQEEIADFIKSIDCYVLGSRTYEHALELGWVYGDTPTVVVTGRKLPSTRKSVEFYSGDLKSPRSRKPRAAISKYMACGRGDVIPAFSRARIGGRNQVDRGSCPIGRRAAAIRLADGADVGFEERGCV